MQKGLQTKVSLDCSRLRAGHRGSWFRRSHRPWEQSFPLVLRRRSCRLSRCFRFRQIAGPTSTPGKAYCSSGWKRRRSRSNCSRTGNGRWRRRLRDRRRRREDRRTEKEQELRKTPVVSSGTFASKILSCPKDFLLYVPGIVRVRPILQEFGRIDQISGSSSSSGEAGNSPFFPAR